MISKRYGHMQDAQLLVDYIYLDSRKDVDLPK